MDIIHVKTKSEANFKSNPRSISNHRYLYFWLCSCSRQCFTKIFQFIFFYIYYWNSDPKSRREISHDDTSTGEIDTKQSKHDMTFYFKAKPKLKFDCYSQIALCKQNGTTQIEKFIGTTWGPPGSFRPQMGPMLAPWTLLTGFTFPASNHIRLVSSNTFAAVQCVM